MRFPGETWTPEEAPLLSSLSEDQDVSIVEKYDEGRNGFALGEVVCVRFPDGIANVEMTHHTNTFGPHSLPPEVHLPEQFAGFEAGQVCLALVRFRVKTVLQMIESQQ